MLSISSQTCICVLKYELTWQHAGPSVPIFASRGIAAPSPQSLAHHSTKKRVFIIKCVHSEPHTHLKCPYLAHEDIDFFTKKHNAFGQRSHMQSVLETVWTQIDGMAISAGQNNSLSVSMSFTHLKAECRLCFSRLKNAIQMKTRNQI